MTATGESAVRAARRLASVASAVLTVMTIAAAVGVIGGVAVAIVGEGRAEKLTGLAIMAGSALTWLTSALPCYAAQAFARYIEFRAVES